LRNSPEQLVSVNEGSGILSAFVIRMRIHIKFKPPSCKPTQEELDNIDLRFGTDQSIRSKREVVTTAAKYARVTCESRAIPTICLWLLLVAPLPRTLLFLQYQSFVQSSSIVIPPYRKSRAYQAVVCKYGAKDGCIGLDSCLPLFC
jgi:hypothetical protein